MPPRRRGHRALPHTADVILEAWGPDLAACCEEAVSALVETYVAPGAWRIVAEQTVHLGPGRNDRLLLAVLDEVIFLLDTADAVPVGAAVRAADGGLELSIRLAAPSGLEPTGALPKAVSRSGLEVTARTRQVRCRFLVDL